MMPVPRPLTNPSAMVWGCFLRVAVVTLCLAFLRLSPAVRASSSGAALAEPATQAVALPPADGPVRFVHLGVEDGLPDSQVHAFLRDHLGFLWIGTRDGLARFDGYRFTVYRHDPENPHSPGGSWIDALMEDRRGDLWVQLGVGGVDRFDRESRRFEHVLGGATSEGGEVSVWDLVVDHEDNVWMASNHGIYRASGEDRSLKRWDFGQAGFEGGVANVLLEDRRQRLLVGTCGGLLRFVPGEERFESLGSTASCIRLLLEDGTGDLWLATDEGLERWPDGDSSSAEFFGTDRGLPGLPIIDWASDGEGRLWVATGGGLARREPGADRLEGRVFFGARKPDGGWVQWLAVDAGGRVWASTPGGGIGRYRAESGEFERFRHRLGDRESLPSDAVSTLFADAVGNVWVGTAGHGAALFAPYRWKLQTYRYALAEALGRPGDLLSVQVTALAEGEGDQVWVGTTGGLLLFDRQEETFEPWPHGLAPPWMGEGEGVLALARTADGALWISAPYSGLGRLDPDTGSILRFRHDSEDEETLSSNQILHLQPSRDGHGLWIGTATRGLDYLDLATGRVERHGLLGHAGNEPGIWALSEDEQGILWVGTPSHALHRFDPRTGELTTPPVHQGDGTLNNRTVCSLLPTSEDTLWVGTFSGGLNRFNRETGRVEAVYTEHDGLPSNMVQGLLEEHGGTLWLITNGGLAWLDPESGEVRTLDRRDGLQHDESGRGVFLATRDGEMLVGGRGGLTRFRPGDIQHNPQPPPVELTSLRVQGEPVAVDPAGLKELELAPSQKVFSIGFAALDFTDPHKNRYAWRLEGFDQDWVGEGTGRVATYTNLDPGRYLFRVKGSNSDGVWSERSRPLAITVRPPFWRTWWFYGLEALAAMLLLALAFLAQRRQLERQQQEAIRRRDLARKTEELEYARRLQLSWLPARELRQGDFLGVGRMVTASEVGGDYFDFLPLEDGRSCLAIGDAIGHGTAAGLVVGMAKAALLQALDSSNGRRVGAEGLITTLDRTLAQALADRKDGMALGLVLLDGAEGRAEICSVAMPFPYHYSAAEDRLRALELAGFPLGRRGTLNLHSVDLELESGDVLVLTSDGLAERLDASDEPWGYTAVFDTVLELCRRQRQPAALADALLAACDEHAGGREPADDMTVVVIRREA